MVCIQPCVRHGLAQAAERVGNCCSFGYTQYAYDQPEIGERRAAFDSNSHRLRRLLQLLRLVHVGGNDHDFAGLDSYIFLDRAPLNILGSGRRRHCPVEQVAAAGNCGARAARGRGCGVS